MTKVLLMLTGAVLLVAHAVLMLLPDGGAYACIVGVVAWALMLTPVWVWLGRSLRKLWVAASAEMDRPR